MDPALKDSLSETFVSSESIYQGKVINVFSDTVRLPDGNTATRDTVRHVGAVAIVALTDDGKVITELQYRYPVDEIITEIPAGKLESRDEDPLEAAKRELREETGYTAENWKLLGRLYPAVGYSDEVITLFLATGLSRGDTDPDEDEFISVSEVPLEELAKEILEGKIPDAKTQAAVMRVYMQHRFSE